MTMSDLSKSKLETRLIHAGEPRPRIKGAVSMPIFQSSTFESKPGVSYHELGYIRLSTTPNHDALHAKLASLEGGEAGLVTGSGMAAITTTLMTVLGPGDHFLAQDCLYGGTHDFITRELKKWGVACDFIGPDDPQSWEAQLKPNTRAIYVESLTNPLLQVGDLPAMAAFAEAHGLISLIDNTFATPVNFRPLAHGFDLVLHSATKYLNGHSDIVAGAIIGSAEWVGRIKKSLDHFGGALDPHACFLLHRGLKTLALRIRQHNDNTQSLAEALAAHPAVARVHYPGLPGHPHHGLASRLFSGCGGVLSFELKDADGAEKLVKSLKIMVNAPSLGGVETLITRPATTSHVGMSRQDRQRLGISDGLIRVAVGIENVDDLIADLNAGLALISDESLAAGQISMV